MAPPCVALKEWASVVQALHAGHQQILLRRGGVREAAFAPLSSAADGFVLLPAKQFHAAAKLFKPGAARPYHGADVAWDPSSADAIPIKSVARVRWELDRAGQQARPPIFTRRRHVNDCARACRLRITSRPST